MVLIDESGFMLQPLMRRTWAPRGITPVVKAWDRHDRLTAVTALTLTPKRRKCDLFFQLLRHNAKADDLFWFLVGLHRELQRPLLVLWDRLAAHRKTEQYFRELEIPWIGFEYFPAYCPDLNPVEHVWSITKWGRLANWPASNLQELGSRFHNELLCQSTDPARLKRHFVWAGLELN